MDHSAITIRDGTVFVDRFPKGDRQNACQTASVEVFDGWGIINIRNTFPARFQDWKPEYPPEDLPDEVLEDLEDNDPASIDVTESHLVVPVRVEKRGSKIDQVLGKQLKDVTRPKPAETTTHSFLCCCPTHGVSNEP